MRPLQFPDLYPTTTGNRDLSFFLQKIPARTRLQHPSAGYLPRPIEISLTRAPATVHRMCSIRFPEAWGLETVWKTPPWFGPESREGIKALREEAPPRTPDAAHTCQKADDLLDLCRSGSSGLDLVSTHQRYGRSV